MEGELRTPMNSESLREQIASGAFASTRKQERPFQLSVLILLRSETTAGQVVDSRAGKSNPETNSGRANPERLRGVAVPRVRGRVWAGGFKVIIGY
jgi:hypothetical protein